MESLRLSDEEDYEYEILSILNITHAWTSVILAGKRNSCLILLQVSERVSKWREQVIKCKKFYHFASGGVFLGVFFEDTGKNFKLKGLCHGSPVHLV